MAKIKCLLVDDEPPAIELLANHASMIDQLEVVGKSHSAVKAFDMLNNQAIDLMFLDIRMPVLNGIDFIKSMKHPPSIILTTAYREYAIEGYDLDIIDYLLKPIAFDRFLKAVDRYRNRTFENLNEPKTFIENTSDHLFLSVNRTQHKVMFRDIYYIESLKDYVRVHTKDENLVVKGNLGTMMKKLPNALFVRIHRSYAIGFQHLGSYNLSEIEIANIKLPIGASYKKDFINKINAT